MLSFQYWPDETVRSLCCPGGFHAVCIQLTDFCCLLQKYTVKYALVIFCRTRPLDPETPFTITTMAMRALVTTAVYLLVLTAGVLVHPPAVSALDQKTVTIELSDPMLHARDMRRRWRDFITPDYDVSEESFRLYVRDSYADDVPHGILVWISPGDHGKIPGKYHELFKQHRLLAISAKNSGNERSMYERIMMALDGARYLKRTYTVDAERVYVSGLSGGGRVPSEVAFIYPDLFTGGAYMNGCNYYQNVVRGGGKYWPGFYSDAPASLVRRVKRNRHAFITASNDMNKKQTRKYHQAAKRDGWQHAAYIEQPDHGHDPVGKKWFKKAINALDDPLRKQAASRWTSTFGPDSSSDKTVLQKWLMLRSIWLHGSDAPFVQKARKRMKELQPQANKMATNKLNNIVNQAQTVGSSSRTKKLRSFYRKWKGLSVREQVYKELQKQGRKAFQAFRQQRDVSAKNIRSFYDRWIRIGVQKIAKRAREFYEYRARQASQSFDTQAPVREQLNKFKQFEIRWAGTKMADKARQRINDLLQDVLKRIKKKPPTPQTTKALMSLFIQFPRTETADKIAKILHKRGKIDELNRRVGQVRQGK